MSLETFKWAKKDDKAWASQAVERNGKRYWYICCNCAQGDAIGVAGGLFDLRLMKASDVGYFVLSQIADIVRGVEKCRLFCISANSRHFSVESAAEK